MQLNNIKVSYRPAVYYFHIHRTSYLSRNRKEKLCRNKVPKFSLLFIWQSSKKMRKMMSVDSLKQRDQIN